MTIEQLQRRLDREKSARVQAEQLLEAKSTELYQLNSELLAAKERLEATLEMEAAHKAAVVSARLKSQFLANMSHELRTPMNGVLGMLSLLQDTELGAEQRDFTETAKRSAEGLLRILNDVLDFSRIEAGKLAITNEEFRLRDEIWQTVEMFAELAEEKGLDLLCDIDGTVPDVLVGDAGRLRQVLVNLLGNGLKFTDRGEVELRITAGGAGDDWRIRFEVHDSGIGIPESSQVKLFQPFVQADGSTTRLFGGTGLGLSIARQLVELMGGEMGMESREGEGSRFWFTLPLEARGAAVASGILAGKRVLLVDRIGRSRAIWRRRLEEWGASVVAATIGEARRALADRAEFEVAVVDCSRPGEGGFELASEWRKSGKTQGMNLVLLGTPHQRGEHGDSAWLAKPVRDARLLSALGDGDVQKHRRAGSVFGDGAGNTQRKRVLVVDDNRVNLKVASEMVRRLGFEVATADNGLEAVEAVMGGEFALVLMDCQMPLMDGFAATAAIRALDGAVREIPIVAVTANAMNGDRERCLAAGMDEYMSKPYEPQRMREILDRYASITSPGHQRP